MAEQVERDHAVAALGEAARERLVHALAEQQAVQQDDGRAGPRRSPCRRAGGPRGENCPVRSADAHAADHGSTRALVNAGVSVDDACMETSAAVRPIPGSASDERSSRSSAPGPRRPSRRSTTATPRHPRLLPPHARLRPRRPRTRSSTPSWPPTATSSASDKPIQLRPWLYTIARNRCSRCCARAASSRSRAADEPSTEHLSSAVQRRQDLRDLLADLAALPDDQRAALVLAELGAVSHDEIANVLGVPRDKVKALVFQGRSSLIASRKARDTPCEEIREQLASCAAARCGARSCAVTCASAPAAARSGRLVARSAR